MYLQVAANIVGKGKGEDKNRLHIELINELDTLDTFTKATRILGVCSGLECKQLVSYVVMNWIRNNPKKEAYQ